MAVDTRTEARATFVYRALDAQGGEANGMLTASSEQEVARKLRSEGKTVLSVARDSALASNARPQAAKGAIHARRSDLAALCRHLGTMSDAGVPLSEALTAASSEGTRPEFKPFVASVALDVESGMPLSQAFMRRGKGIPAIVIALARAAESTGQMGPMLMRAAEHLRRSERIGKQLRAAASYPIFMLTAGSAVVLVLMLFVLPRFAKLYADRGAELPVPTKALLMASNLVREHWMLLGLGVAAIALGIVWLTRSKGGGLLLDRMRFGAPVIGKVSRTAFVAVSCRTLATLLASGIQLLDAIAICRGLVHSARAEAFWTAVDAKLRNGSTLVEALHEENMLPPTVVSMIAAGERTGRLSEVLTHAADFAEEDLEMVLKQATSLLEPVMVLVFGSVLGGVAIALLLPLFGASTVVAK